MEKVKIKGDVRKAALKARARDRVYKFVLGGGTVRGALINAPRMITEMRANHKLGILETFVLGQAYLAAALTAAELKATNRLRIQINCSGPIKGWAVDANTLGEVRGYLFRVPIPLEQPMESFDLTPFYGPGVLSLTRYLQDAKHPFTGQTALLNGSLAKDLANYYFESEQIPTAFHLSIKFDRQGLVAGAGGLFLQALPQAKESLLSTLEERVARMPSLGEWSAARETPESLLAKHFADQKPKILDHERVEFHCSCNRDRMGGYIRIMPVTELADIIEKGPFPLAVTCHFCNTSYRFQKDEIKQFYHARLDKPHVNKPHVKKPDLDKLN